MKIPSELDFPDYVDLVREHLVDPDALNATDDTTDDTDELLFVAQCQERDILPEDCADDLETGAWHQLVTY